MPDYRLTPRYRTKSPLDEVLRKTEPKLDEFPTEKYAEEIEAILGEWRSAIEHSPSDVRPLLKVLSSNFEGSALGKGKEQVLRSEPGLQVWRSDSSSSRMLKREDFAREIRSFLSRNSSLITAEFKLASIRAVTQFPADIETRVRYDLVSSRPDCHREQRVGHWELRWKKDSEGQWHIQSWRAREETRSRAPGPVFVDITSRALAGNNSYRQQMLRGTDYWRTVLDAASGINVYGNNGIACGDIDNDGFDDLYVCQPAGLPNRLYRNRGDGTFEDVTKSSGVDVLNNTPCALFVDVNNDGLQDLLVVRAEGPLLFLNQGKGKFRLRPDAFRFAQSPQGTFTGAAAADYNLDGRLDIYFCLYSYYRGQDQYRYPLPYYDARNGPPNFLFQNNHNGTFTDVTAASGLSRNNDRFSFACGWCDYDSNGLPDLYVANDFGRNNLYRNNGDGTFTDVAQEAGVEDIGAGMSVCWFDYENDGNQDLFVSDMWSAAGNRLTSQEAFRRGMPEEVRASYRKHAKGNSLFRNDGKGRFRDVSRSTGVEMGRWAWSADAWDFDHDGFPDLFIANGMISGSKTHDL